ncbi:MAG: T9SS type A sorting domain-containing protein [Candidatus Kapabacteria bacterium]|nr:T9SS type A sorting domain-containing protein [Ignavibacteriota bacterium]MCW5885665.1 T9SS type A sorting domain-containing protein [Candidatus Kapabacteria bacterium]
MGSKYADNPTNLTVDNAGNVILAGEYISDTLHIENEKYTKNGELGHFIAKYSKNGDLIYTKNFTSAVENDSTNSVYIPAIKTDSDNNMNVIMSFSNSVIIEDSISFENKNAVNKWLMVRYDENGKLLWAKTFDFTKLVNHSGLGISDFDLDELGNFYFVGNISNGKILLDNGFEIDAGYNGASFITKHDRDGKCIWAETIAGSVGGLEFSYLKAHKNRCYVYGKIQEGKKFNSRKEEILGLDKRGIFIIQTEAISNISRAYGIPVPKWIAPRSFCIDNNDKLIISGDFTDSISFGGDFTFDVSLNLEIFIAKFDMTTTDVTEYQNKNELVLFPNPTSDFITIQTSEVLETSEVSKIQIFDVLGIKVMSESIHPMTSNHRMNVKKLPAGVYFIRIGTRVEKFVKM